MCGIACFYVYNKSSNYLDRDELKRIIDFMQLRGPDDSGTWFSKDNRVGLGHRRLSIIDLSTRGSQPMANEDNSLIISYNGEIYNYKELRTQLIKKGYRFRSNSDTEVILNLYAEKGDALVYDLRGMYAFAIWDKKNKGIFLARDPFGIKPLYYSCDGNTFRAASQVKALLASGKIDKSPDPAGHVGFFLWGSVPEPYTLYKKIKALPAGTSLWVTEQGNIKIKNHCNISDEFLVSYDKKGNTNRSNLQYNLRCVILDSLKYHFVSDVPVVIFLSSGIDSSTIVALANEIAPANLNTITLGFKEFLGTKNDETTLAQIVANKYLTKHETIWIDKKDFENNLHNILHVMDQPSINGVNTYFVSWAAKQAGFKVALSGLGGDELLGGYPSFKQLPLMVRIANAVPLLKSFGEGFRLISEPFFRHFGSPKYSGILEYGTKHEGGFLLIRSLFMPWELSKLFEEDFVHEGLAELQTLDRIAETIKQITNEHIRISAMELCWYMRNQLLRDTDWASMAHSLEVRVPFIDIKLFRAIVPMLWLEKPLNKQDLIKTPLDPLPAAIAKRSKSGFNIPVWQWLLKNSTSIDQRHIRSWAIFLYKNGFLHQ